jgi:hypothetical protein
MDLSSLKDKVVFDPALEPGSGWWYGDLYYDEWSWGLYLYGMKPSTTYTVHILPGMADIYGAEIQTEMVARFTTAPYEPSAGLQLPYGPVLYRTGGPQEFYASYRNIKRWLELYRLSLKRLLDSSMALLSGTTSRRPDLVWSAKVTNTGRE